jgi:hypothetical protein
MSPSGKTTIDGTAVDSFYSLDFTNIDNLAAGGLQAEAIPLLIGE